MTALSSLLPLLALVVVLVVSGAVAQKDDAAALRAFAQWLGDNQVQSNINLGLFENSRFGGVAARALTEEDYLVKLPKSLLLTPETVQARAPFPTFNNYSIALEPWILFVLSDRLRSDSFWKPYWDILPSDLSNLPIFWSDEDLAELQGSPLRAHVQTLRQTLRIAYDRLVVNLLEPNPRAYPEGYLTFERYLWAYSIVSSRILAAGNTPIIAPLLDLIQHDATAGNPAINEEGSLLIVNATRAYEKGAQVFASFGAKSNFDLLKLYGIVKEDNPADSMTLFFNLKPTTLAQGIVEPILRKIDPNYNQLGIGKNVRPDRLLRAFRVSLLEFGELEQLSEVLEGKPASLENELKTYRLVIQSIQSVLKTYTTTIEDDARLLSEPSLAGNRRNAVLLRKLEKEILVNNILIMGKLWENILLEGTLPLGVPLR